VFRSISDIRSRFIREVEEVVIVLDLAGAEEAPPREVLVFRPEERLFS
jgi:hypothetical protein